MYRYRWYIYLHVLVLFVRTQNFEISRDNQNIKDRGRNTFQHELDMKAKTMSIGFYGSDIFGYQTFPIQCSDTL
jgi:hypothetical protein